MSDSEGSSSEERGFEARRLALETEERQARARRRERREERERAERVATFRTCWQLAGTVVGKRRNPAARVAAIEREREGVRVAAAGVEATEAEKRQAVSNPR